MWTAGADTDLDGDGVLDAVGLDVDVDGLIDDVMVDFDDDGPADHAVLDLDGDGIPEAYFTDDGTGTWSVSADRGGAVLRWFGLDGVEHPASPARVDLDGDGVRSGWPTSTATGSRIRRSGRGRHGSTPTATVAGMSGSRTEMATAPLTPPNICDVPAAAERASAAAWPRRSGEGLRDRQPLLGVRPDRDDIQLAAGAALGDEHAEVFGRTGDPLGGVLGTPGPLGLAGGPRRRR